MRIVSWNLAHQTKNKPVREGFLSAIAQLRPDVLILNEYVHGDHRDDFESGLRQLGLAHIAVSTRHQINNQVLIASPHPLEEGDLAGPETESKGGESNFLHVRVPALDIEVVGLRVPAYQASTVLREYWEKLTTLIASTADRRIVYAGDFNADPASESYIGGKYLAHLSWEEWAITEAEGSSFLDISRLDHALVPSSLEIRSAAYVREVDGKVICGRGRDYVSDHAALSVDIELAEIEEIAAPTDEGGVKHSEQPPAFANRGSQRWLQVAVNNHPELLNSRLREALQLPSMSSIEWLSPLGSGRYGEYRDYAAIERLGVSLERGRLREFWPTRGPVWDGLARTSTGDVLLIEAKAHIAELACGGCNASARSLERIRASIRRVQDELAVGGSGDWCGPFYQYANRLAHLHFLRENKVRAHLVYVYFLNAEDVFGPSSQEEFLGAIKLMESVLGVRRHHLSRFVHKVFVDVRELTTSVELPSTIPLRQDARGQELTT